MKAIPVSKVIISDHDLKLEGNVDFPTFLQLVCSGLLAMMKQTRKAGISGEDIYDAVNLAMGNILNLFDPELDKRPDLSETAMQAVLNTEDYILEKAAAGDIEALRIVTGNIKLQESDLIREESSTDAQDVEQS